MNDRSPLPAPGQRYLADAGLETWLIYHEGVALREFAAFELLDDADGRARLSAYYRAFLDLAARTGHGLVLEAPTWRANPDWGAKLGHDAAALDRLNGDAIALLRGLRAESRVPSERVVLSGCVGPRHDGYVVAGVMAPGEAAAYHRPQLAAFAAAGADAAAALTMTTWQEAAGVARAARELGLPLVVSFTVETDGRLPSGQRLGEAIAAVDHSSDGHPAYYMINCAHPEHFAAELASGEPWVARLGGLRVNASRCSHEELNAMTALDDGDPRDLAARCRALAAGRPALRVLGGCCGTDLRHVAAMAGQAAGAAG